MFTELSDIGAVKVYIPLECLRKMVKWTGLILREREGTCLLLIDFWTFQGKNCVQDIKKCGALSLFLVFVLDSVCEDVITC